MSIPVAIPGNAMIFLILYGTAGCTVGFFSATARTLRGVLPTRVHFPYSKFSDIFSVN